MSPKNYAHIFKSAPARAVSKSDATDRAAREIIDRDATAADAKTDRLRAARLAREAEQAELAAQQPAPVKKRKKQSLQP
jgi:hypothetical protein